MELDHMKPQAEGGGDEIDNAIPLCFDCHAEVHAYNPNHPRGRKFTASELKAHRDQWLAICASRPEVFTEPARDADVGPIQALVDELEFNRYLAAGVAAATQIPPRYLTDQFRRAVAAGSISMLRDEIKATVLRAYADVEVGNSALRFSERDRGATKFGSQGKVPYFGKLCVEAAEKVRLSCETARKALLRFLGSGEE